MVSFDHVNKTYPSRRGEVQAVRDLCLGVTDRELVVLVGTRRAIGIALRNNKITERHTALDARLRE